MPKRFTDTGKWKKKWFRGLSSENKLFWHYLLDNCDHAGVWEVDFGLASYQIGIELNEEEITKTFADKIVVFDNGERWYIKDFVEFQYGELKENNHAHASVLKILTKHGLNGFARVPSGPEGLASPPKGGLSGHKDKDKAKAKDVVKEKDQDKDENRVRTYALPEHYCEKHDLRHTDAFCPRCIERTS